MNGSAKKLTIYVDEADKYHEQPVYEALINLFYEKKIAGVSVFRGVAGYGGDRIFHTAKLLELSTSLPVKIEVIDTEDKINSVLPDVSRFVVKGLVEICDTVVIQSSGEKK